MSKAIKCDRCGEFSEKTGLASQYTASIPNKSEEKDDVRIGIKFAGSLASPDLCPSCLDSLMRWWLARKNDNGR